MFFVVLEVADLLERIGDSFWIKMNRRLHGMGMSQKSISLNAEWRIERGTGEKGYFEETIILSGKPF